MGSSLHPWLPLKIHSQRWKGSLDVLIKLLRVIDRILPRLSHINPAVVFGSVRLIVRYLEFLSNEDLIKNLVKKLGPSLVSVISIPAVEIQYVVLKNIQYIIEKRPSILENEIKCFFCKFSDPYYVKNEKMYHIINQVKFSLVSSTTKTMSQCLRNWKST